MTNPNCSCPHTTCDKNGDCKADTAFHKGKPYCKATNGGKRAFRVQFWVYDNVLSKILPAAKQTNRTVAK